MKDFTIFVAGPCKAATIGLAVTRLIRAIKKTGAKERTTAARADKSAIVLPHEFTNRFYGRDTHNVTLTSLTRSVAALDASETAFETT